jgi:hypothetical protein
MFDSSSRYADDRVSVNIFVAKDGRRIPYKQRRFVPDSREVEVAAELEIQPADRLDLIAARALGDPLLFWRICDANGITHPFAEHLEPGAILQVPGPAV